MTKLPKPVAPKPVTPTVKPLAVNLELSEDQKNKLGGLFYERMNAKRPSWGELTPEQRQDVRQTVDLLLECAKELQDG